MLLTAGLSILSQSHFPASLKVGTDSLAHSHGAMHVCGKKQLHCISPLDHHKRPSLGTGSSRDVMAQATILSGSSQNITQQLVMKALSI